LDLRNIGTVAESIAQSNLARKESRSLQCILDYPDLDLALATRAAC